jgi:WD40 repeat protein
MAPRDFLFLSSLALLLVESVYAVPYLEVEEVVTLGGVIMSVDISPDGDYVVTGTEDGYIYFINRSSGLSWRKKLHSPIFSIAVSFKGDFVAAGDDSRVYLFNKTGDLVWWDSGRTIGDYVRDVDISLQGDYVVAGSSNDFIYLFEDGREIWHKNLGSSIWGVGISPTGEYVAAGTVRGEVYLFKRSGELVWHHNLGRFISDVAVQGQVVVVAAKFVHSISGGEVSWSYYPKSEAFDVGFSSDGEFIIIGAGNDAYLLDDKGKVLFQYSTGDILRGVAVSNGGTMAVGVGKEVRLLVLPDVTPPELNITYPLNGSWVSAVVSITASTNEPLKFLQVLIDDNFACGTLPCNWDTSASSPGKHIITIIAEDEKGNRGENKIEVYIGEESEFDARVKPEGLLGEVKEILVSEEEISGGIEEEFESGTTVVLPPPAARRWSINFEIFWIIIGIILLVLAAGYLRHRRGYKKRYRWKGRRRRWSLR